MRISGPISVQRTRPAPGWTAYGLRVVYLVAHENAVHVAPALPPQQRGDAACLTLLMAQTLGGGIARSGGYEPTPDDDTPIFALSA